MFKNLIAEVAFETMEKFKVDLKNFRPPSSIYDSVHNVDSLGDLFSSGSESYLLNNGN